MGTHHSPHWSHIMSHTLLLHTASPSEATAKIAALGGRVTQRLASDILLAMFPEGFDKRKLKRSTLMSTPTGWIRARTSLSKPGAAVSVAPPPRKRNRRTA